ADLRHVVGEKLLDLRFIPGDAGDGDHLLQKSDRCFTAVVDLLHKRLAETRTHLRSPKKPGGRSVIVIKAAISPQSIRVRGRCRLSTAVPPAMNFTLESRRCAAQSRNQNFHYRPRSPTTLT